VKIMFLMVGLDQGGASVYIIRLAEALIKRNAEVEVVSLRCLEETKAVVGDKEIPWSCLGMRNLYDFSIILPIIFKLRQFQPDLVHTNHPIDAMFGNLAARIVGVPCLTTFHSPLDHNCISKTNILSRRLTYLRYLWAERLAGRFAHKSIAVSNFIKDELINHSICTSDKVSVIHHGVDLERFDAKNYPNHSSEYLTVGSISRISQEKGIQYFIEAAIQVSDTWPDVRFDLVGEPKNGIDEHFFENCLKLVTVSGKESRIRFLGYKADITASLSTMDIVVVPSLSEGFGLTIIEAMAMGKPVVASKVGAIPEIVLDGETGLLVEPGNADAIAKAVECLLRDAELRDEMGKKARLWAEEAFSQKRTIEQTLHCYEFT